MGKLDFSKTAAARSARQRMQQTMETNIKESVVEIPVNQLYESPFNEGMPLEGLNELAESIKTYGQQEACLVYKTNQGYEIYAGARRFHAIKDVLKAKTCRCIVKKYPKDIRERFADHFINNSERRQNNFRYWIAEVSAAEKLLEESGFEGSRKEEEQEILKLLGNKISIAQLRRVCGIRNMEPSMQSLGDLGYSAKMVYEAVSLDADQQNAAAQIIRELMAEKRDVLSPSEFTAVISGVKEGKTEKEQKKPDVKTNISNIEKMELRFISTLKKTAKKEDKTAALASIVRMRALLDAAEEELRNG